MTQGLIVHNPAPWAVRVLGNGKRVIVKAYRDRPLNGECPVWSLLKPADRVKLYQTKFQ